MMQVLKETKEHMEEQRMENYNIIEQPIKENNISALEILNAFVNRHGTQIIDDEFVEYLKEEGIVTE